MNNQSPIHDNIEGMLRLGTEFPDLRLMGSLAEWRIVPERPEGEVLGVWDGVKLLATDGVAAFFLRGDGTVLYGHLRHFVADKKDPNLDREYRPKRVSVRQERLANMAMED